MTRYYVQGQRLTPYFAGQGKKEVFLLTSGDGIHFRSGSQEPILSCELPNAFDSQNIFFWSDAEERYVCYLRFMDPLRTMARTTSPDVVHWTEPVPMTYGDTPREQLYTNTTTPYFRAPHVYISLSARFMAGRRVVTDEQLERMAVAAYGDHVYYNDCSDVVLLTTRAGSTQYDRTFMESFVRPGIGLENWVSRTNYPFAGLLQTGPNELSFYVSRHYAQPSWHIRRFTLRLDGFVSVNAPYSGGRMTTKSLICSGERLEVNFATGAAGSMRVEMQDIGRSPIPGYTFGECDELIGDETERIVSWRGRTDVSAIAGKPIRLCFEMKDVDLYSLCFH
jgi:hypothetical protein